MNITLKNKELIPTINFLQGLKLKNADSRHRSKLVKLLTTALDEFAESEQDLLKEHNLVDEKGAILPEDQQAKEQVDAYNIEQKKLYEEVVIVGGMYAKNIDELPRILEALDIELEGKEAEVYDRLLDEMEK